MKVFLFGLFKDAVIQQAFEREGRILTEIQHPSIIPLLDYGVEPETRRPFLVLDWGGTNLKASIDKSNIRDWDPEGLRKLSRGGFELGKKGRFVVCMRSPIRKLPQLTQANWEKQLHHLWPALKGSLSEVFKPCIRKNCPACQRGDKHSAWQLTYTHNGKRRCIYVPLDLVPTIQNALANGRRIEEILYATGPAIILDYRDNLATSHNAKPIS